MNNISVKEDSTCTDSGAHGNDQTAAAAKGDLLLQTASKHGSGMGYSESSERDSEGHPSSGSMTVYDSARDGSPHAVSPEGNGIPSPSGGEQVVADLSRPVSGLRIAIEKNQQYSDPQRFIFRSIEETLDEDPLLALQTDFQKRGAKIVAGNVLNRGISPTDDQGPVLIDLPTDRPRSLQQSTAGSMLPIRLGKQQTQSLKAIAREHGVDLNVVLLAAWVAILSRLSGQPELVLAVQGFASDLEASSADAFAYSLISTHLSDDSSSEQLLEHIKGAVLEAAAPQSLHKKTLATRHQALFDWYNDQGQSSIVEDLGYSSSSAFQVEFDVELHLQDVDEQIVGTMRFATALFDPCTIERHVGHLHSMLEGMVSNPSQSISKINIISPAERMLLLDTWNITPTSNQEIPTIHQLFEEQVKRTPEAIALVYEDQQLAYAELNTRSNSLAHRLIELGVRPDTCVAICVDRSMAMVVGMLAILKAGGAYVPLDPTYPSERLRDVINDAAPSILLADHVGRDILGDVTLASLTVVDPNTQGLEYAANPQIIGLTSHHLAYVIYTSGSTGKPKGVMVEHRGVVSLVQHQSEFYGVHEHSRSLQLASISFDVSVWEIFLSICAGLTLYLAPDDIRMDRDKLWNYVVQHSITFVTCTPSFLQEDRDLPTAASTTTTTKPVTLVLGGEALNTTLLQNLLRQGITVFNDYGPTEASISAATWKCPVDYDNDIVPIGRPVRNARLYVLDAHQQLAPVGTVGELYIGGAGVARGYLNRPEQTAERFLLDPFSKHQGARMYRTGDLVRYLPDGNLVYLGRADDQVKIRGFRVELGEIEAQLAEHDLVTEAVIVALGEESNKRLVAYVIPRSGELSSTVQLPMILRSHLAKRLPDYMVPAAFVHLDALPLTANGKLDRRALPAPGADDYARQVFDAPRGQVEKAIAAIWSDLLCVEGVSRHDNFFALGGHSLLAAKVLDHLRRMGLTISLRALFEYPTLSALAQAVEVYHRVTIPANLITPESDALTPEMLPLIDLNQSDIDRIIGKIPGGLSNIKDIYSLSPLQEGLLFHHLLATEGDPYLLTSTIAFESRALLDRYLTAFQTVVDRHDILRTAFFWEKMSTTAQVVQRSVPLPIEELILDPADGDILEQLDRRFNPKHYRIDLCHAPLLRFVVVKDTSDRWILVQLIHHLIGDHDAEEEMHIEIKALLDGQGGSLPKPRSFRDHVAQIRMRSNLEADETFFRRMLFEVDEPTLPFGLTKVDHGGAKVKESHRILSQDLNDRLRLQTKELRVSLATICHVAWAQVLARICGQQQVVFGTVLSGRLQTGDGYRHALGLYMNTLPFLCDIDKRSALYCVQNTHSRLTVLLEHEHASLALAQRCSRIPRDTPLFSGLLNYRHSSPPSISIPGTSNAELMSQEGWFEYPGLQFVNSQERTNYPFGLSVDDFGTSLGLTAQVMQPFDPARICGYMQKALESLADALECARETPIQKLEVLPIEECQMMLKDWNATQQDYPDHLCLHHLFEQQVERTPEAVAVVHGDQSLTYAELNIRANDLAHRLIALGVRPDSLVAICVERSPAMIVGVLAILKAGGAYVPLDPLHASERLRDILRESAPICLVADRAGRRILDEAALSSSSIVDPNQPIPNLTLNPLITSLTSQHLAYVMYTSGSTGKPKGVMVEHRGVVSLVQYHCSFLDIHKHSRILQQASISFDFSAWEIFLPISSGATLYLTPDSIRMDRDKLWEYMIRHSITMAAFTPSFLQDGKAMPTSTTPLTLVLGGEALSATLLQNLLRQGITVFNDYGPTEASISAATWKCPVDYDNDIVPIGRPVRNARLYVLDAHQQLAPVGTVGELYIGGAGVARGYLNRPEQTAERFLLDPFSKHQGARMYRTGDLVRYLPDGNLVYLGRADDQVKIRGFRVELGEIEAQLAEHDLVTEAVIVALGEESNKRLVAYVIPRSGELSSTVQLPMILRSHLAKRLPDYMVPAAFVHLDALPLTANGKLDRRALPAPGADDYARQVFDAPRGQVEKAIAAIWSDLLRVERVGRHDSFFALGGHSLLVVQVISRLHHLGHSVSVRAVFESPTLSVLAQSLGQHVTVAVPPNLIPRGTATITPEMLPLISLEQTDIDHIVENVPGGVANIQDIYALSPLQDGILFHHLMAKNGDPYLRYTAVPFDSRKSLDRYLAVIQQIVNRHDILRTAFVWQNLSIPAQVVWRDAQLSITELHLDPADGLVINQLKKMFDPRNHRMDLTQAPLLRFVIAQESDGRWILVELQHHLIGDHSTLETMQMEIQAFYEGQEETLPFAEPYRNVIAQARLGLSEEEHERFFKEMLADIDNPSLPFGIADVHGDGIQVTEAERMLSQDLNNRLRSQAKRLGVSLASLCHVAWAQVIARTCGQQRVVFGTVLLGRMQAATSSDRAMGLFINTLPIRVDLDRGSVEETVRATHARLAALLEHEHASLALAQRCSGVAAGVPLFSALLNYRHNVSTDDDANVYGMEFLGSEERSNYPFSISVEDYGTSLGLTAKVLQPLDPARVCGYMQESLNSLACSLESYPSMLVAKLEVLPTDERQMLLKDWNATQQDYPDHLCLHHLFERQVERTPEAVAIVHGDQSLTYAELNIRANDLAHRLIALGVRPDSLVAICVERSPAMIVGVLAILKAGGAYVPLDPFYASDRLRDVINDAAPSILLADHVGRDILGDVTLASLTVVDPNTQGLEGTANPQIIGLTSHHLAYVIYTSGSTGTPKGVMLEHQGVVNLVLGRFRMFEIHPSSRVLQFTSLGFDHSVSEIFSTLCCGASLHLVLDDIRLDKQRLWNLFHQSSLTHVSFTPSLLQDCQDMPVVRSIRVLVVMGESVPIPLPTVLKAIAPCSTIFNSYGPTEASIAASVWKCPKHFGEDIVPIGRPLPNKIIYLLDVHGNPVPLGAIGEIYIGGVGVARGYLNRPDLTMERFIADPFAAEPGARMYRTGDMARYLPDGNLVHMGRNDHQVKIRGFRIELGEIETRLHEHPLVSKAVVVVQGEGSDKRLVAYVIDRHVVQPEQGVTAVAASSAVPLASMLRSYLATRLPEYMVPMAFVRMDAFPLTPNGKLDRRALPVPRDGDFARQEYEAPQGEVENALAAIWTDLLRVERVGRHDSFFTLGGHSLLAVRLMNRISKLGAIISLPSLFDSPTLASFAAAVSESIAHGTATVPGISPVSHETVLPLSFAQQRLWFLAQLEGVSEAYHISKAIHFCGQLDQSAWKQAWDELYARHEALRSVFVGTNGQPEVHILPPEGLQIRWIDLRGAADRDMQQERLIYDETRRRFDLSQGPLIRVVMIQLADTECVLLVTQHHIVSDGWSSGIMLNEISQLYTAYCKGEPSPLTPLAIQYPDYAAWQRQWLSGDLLQAQSDYWRTALSGAPVLIDLPTDRPRPAQQSFKGDHIPITLDARLTSVLKALGQKHGVTLFMTILSAWSVVLSRLSGQDDIVIGTPSANRSRQEIESLIGFFVNTLAMRVDMSGEPSTRELLERTRRSTLAAYAHQDLPFEQVVEIVQPPRTMNHTPLFQVMFVWQNNEEEEWDLPGLQVSPYEFGNDTAKFDLTLALWESGDVIEGSLGYATSLFDQSTVERHVGYLDMVLQAMVSDVDQSLADVDILSPAERTLLVHTWNDTREQYPDQLCLHHLFEQQVERTPEAVAVVHGDQSLTYAELNVRANSLAHHLIALGVRPDSLVAICVERSPAMIVGVLAILKAGGAYVPLDPFYASDRLRDVINDAAPSILLADHVGRDILGDVTLASLTVVDPNTQGLEGAANPQIIGLTSHHLAYVIYTSGSTGTPKGVMLEHQGVVNLVLGRFRMFEIHPSSRVLQFTSLGFDHSVSEIFSTLCCGASLHLVLDDIRLDKQRLWNLFHQSSLTHVSFTPSLLQDCQDMPVVRSIRVLVVMGESVPIPLPTVLKAIAPCSTIFNSYGPTEASIAASVWKCPKHFGEDIVPIGRPLPNKIIYLLDVHGNPVPLGAIGEIYIGGVGVARGYLNRPDLTMERFIADPFAAEPGARMYRTGDMARYLPDGNLVHMGRNDHQVKIRGFRIELGEIETRLHEHPLVSKAVVVVQGEGSDKRLVAYVIDRHVVQPEQGVTAVAASSAVPLASMLRSYLATRLPEYMVPMAFVRMDAFPLTSNGKLDRRALPVPRDGDFARQEYEAPQGEVENALAAIWTDLLRVERVGRHDSFFTLGGHSLLAVRLMNRISKLGAIISLPSLFDSPTLASFAAAVSESIAHGTATVPGISPVSHETVLPLSFAQQRLWFLAQLEGVSEAYHISKAIHFCGQLDQSAWKQAWDELYARHEALRSVFVGTNGQPEVHILPPEGLQIRWVDLRGAADRDMQQERLIYDETRRRFDLSQGPLIRVVMIQLADTECVLLVTQHHIVSDGWSSGIMLNEISQLYTAYCKGEPSPLTPLAIQYPDYAAWQRQWLSGDLLQAQSDYWRTALSGAPVLIDLPTDRPRPAQQSFKGDHIPITLDARLTSVLKALGQKHGVTLFMTILSAWSVVLSRLSGQDDIVIGTPSANRSRQEIESLIGFFVNTLAMRVDMSGEPSTRELLERTRRSTLAAYAHQDLPFEQVVEIVQPPRTMNHTPLFQVMFVWQNNEEGEWDLPGLQVSPYEFGNDTAKFDLTLALWESGDVIEGSLGYATSLFDQSTVERHVGYLDMVLQAMVSDVDQSLADVDILSPAERTLLVHTWNDTREQYPDQLCLHHLFEQQVERTPEAVAIVHGDQSLTYAELNVRANSLAHHLIALGVRPDSLVAICVERSPAMIVGVLAILKAGGAYVPLDPFYASDRLRDVINDAAPSILLADHVGRDILGDVTLASLTVVDPNTQGLEGAANPQIIGLTSHHLVYVIYTSGSTGKPKGVMVEHRMIVVAFDAAAGWFHFDEYDTWSMFHSFAFDVSVWEMWGALRHGGRLVLVPQSVTRVPQEFSRLLCEQGVTVLNQTPSAFKLLIDCQDHKVIDSLRYVILAGEALAPAILQPWYAKYSESSPRIVNMYGPTETFYTTYRPMKQEDCSQAYSPIGERFPNLKFYVLDRYGHPAPLGATGELYIGGAGIARGYWNRADQTAERFISDPFPGSAATRMYKTGDLVRYLSDGDLVFIGRSDDQVKINGFRVELGEIEARLAEHPSVREAAVITHDTGNNKVLVAYVLAKPEKQLSLLLRSHLVARLPEYMIPVAFVRMDVFPLTPNGKLDRRTLPAPEDNDYARQAYAAPRGEVEKAIASIWSDLLRVERVSRHDSFFTLGGHSLLAVRLMNRISKLGAIISLPSLFNSPTLASFAAAVSESIAHGTATVPAISPVSHETVLPLSFAQQRLWFLAQLEGVSEAYHISKAIHFCGQLDQSAWKQAWDELYARHEALRSVFVGTNGQPEVHILPPEGLQIRWVDLRGAADRDMQQERLIYDETRRRFDLSQGPLIRVVMIQLADTECVLLVTQHHIVSDGWSSGIMLNEISQLYTAYCKGEPSPLTPLAIQYPDYAAWQRQWLSGDLLQAQSDYWRTALSGAPVLIDLPTDRPRPAQQSFKGDHIPITLDARLTSVLKALGQKHGVTLFMTILSAWSVVLSRLSGQDDIVIGTPSANRSRQEIESLIGFFVNTLAMRVDMSGEPSTRELLERTRRSTLAAYAHQDLPFEQVVEIVQPPRTMNHTPLFQVMFVWQNNEEEEWDLPGLQVSPYEFGNDTAKFDLTLALWESGDVIEGSLGYATSLFDQSTVERHVGYLDMVLQAMVSDVDQSLADVDILSPAERTLLVHTWNDTREQYPDQLCLHHLFEQQVERTPEAVAVVHGDQSLTYAELNVRANSLAHHLIALGVRPDSLVAICVERSPAMIVGVLAILKAGGAYVPLDPFYASDRLRDVINDAAPSILLADHVGRDILGDVTLASLTVVDPNTQGLEGAANPQIIGLTSHHLAYVIYTSGSTGTPKGVMLEHQGAVNLVSDQHVLFEMQPASLVLQYTSLGFDQSVWEIFSALRCGSSLHLLKDDIRLDRHRLWDYLELYSITHVSFTPTLLQDCSEMPILHSLRVVVVMGETMPPSLPGLLRNVAPNSTIFNSYGPTESSVASAVWICRQDFQGGGAIPIGRPMMNKRIYILDIHGNPVPLGAIGEIYIGGVGVARGYLNRPDLTMERFIADPFAAEPGARMYRTGDMARYLPDGNLVHMGRNDHQVKIRGFRIELGEIETRLHEHPLVSKAVVVVQGEGSDKRLVAYVIDRHVVQPEQGVTAVAASSAVPLASMLRSYLATRLPEYMVPMAFVRMDAFPLISNGKLDRRALPVPRDGDFARQEYEAPQGEAENTLAAIWTDLLRVERVGRHDSFFALGGHSLLVVQVISRLHHLGHSVSVRAVFESPTLSVLAQSLGQHVTVAIPPNLIPRGTARITPEMLPLISLEQTDIDHIVENVPGGVANIQDIYALSPLQDGILFHHLMAKNGDPYLLFTAVSFDSRKSLDKYLAVIQQIVNRHDILRTAFVWQSLSIPAQVVWRDAQLSITELHLDPADGLVIKQLKKMFDPRNHRMDLTQAPLLRFVIAQESDGRWILVELHHHLIGDHSTLETMQMEIQAFYEGQEETLPFAEPYRNVIAQARLGLSEEEHERFFKEMLADIDNPSLPFGITDVHGEGIQVIVAKRMLSQDLNNRLRSQAKRLGVSLASLCHVAWAQVLARTCGQQRVVFGTVLLGRMQAATSSDRAMGLFINTLPIRVDLDRDSVEETVRATHARLAALLEHEHASLALAQRCSGVAAGVPLFSALLNYRHNLSSSDDVANNYGSEMEFLGSEERSNYPFNISVEDYGTSLGLTAQVVQPLDPARVCGYMQEALDSLACSLESYPSMLVAKLEVLPTDERQMLLKDWNATQQDYPDHLCLHHLFERRVERTPEAVAIVHGDQSLTYAELNIRANDLAHRLIALGVRPDSLVAICVERSPAMIVGVLAILKAGGAYVPLDPFYASDRLRDVINDAAPSILLADHVGRDILGDVTLASLTVVDPNTQGLEGAANPQIIGLTSHHLAYVIYTSGSTGKPKGVMLEHQGAVNLVSDQHVLFEMQPASLVLQYTSLGFDQSVWEIFSALRCGSSLHLLKDDIRLDRHRLWDYLELYSITHVSFTPTLLQDCSEMPILHSLRVVVVMGETMPPSLPGLLRNVAPNSTIFNSYGPTESSVASAVWICRQDFQGGGAIPIGRPMMNKRIYILDIHGNPVPLGAIGEIYIGGVGVARGYLNRPDLTMERFIADPFAAEPGARMYRTGDMARYLPDGNLVHMGRNDHQVKIRGFRIELGEIETRLHEHPLVSKAVVVVQGEGSDKRLVAYVIARQDEENERTMEIIEQSSMVRLVMMLRSHLVKRLPDYMVPAAFVHMNAFPMTPNGKLDRRVLPVPRDGDYAFQAYEEPRGEIENILSSIWVELLGVETVGRYDGFFVLGGHSLLAMRMIGRIRAMLGFDMSLRTLFEAPTIAELAPRLLATGAAQEESYDVLLPIKPRGTRPPLFCIHPVTGLSWCYTGLSTRLDPDQPLYGLQARGFIGDGKMASTLDEMVLDYIEQVRRIQPQGPYHLLGYSFGGLVAHTMASYLEKHGERVAFVALMDTPADYHSRVRQPPDAEEDEEAEKAGLIEMLVGARDQYPTDFVNPFLDKAPMISRNNSRIASTQAPRVIKGDLLIFRATVLSKGVDELWSPDVWKPYVLGKLEVYDIECEHNYMDLPEPTVIVGRILSQKLNELHRPAQREE